MLTVTDKAAQYLRESLTHKEEGTPAALRIVHTEEGYQLTLDDPKDGDLFFEHEGQNYLMVDAEVSEALSDATLDVQESARGETLTLTASRTPQAEETTAEAEGQSEDGAKAKAESESEPAP